MRHLSCRKSPPEWTDVNGRSGTGMRTVSRSGYVNGLPASNGMSLAIWKTPFIAIWSTRRCWALLYWMPNLKSWSPPSVGTNQLKAFWNA